MTDYFQLEFCVLCLLSVVASNPGLLKIYLSDNGQAIKVL